MIVKIRRCLLCNKLSFFSISRNATLLREAKCNKCGASLRNNAIAFGILKYLGIKHLRDIENKKIYETSSSGRINEELGALSGYVCSEYYPKVPSGSFHGETLSEDLQNLSFPNNYFDIVISQDVLEHVTDTETAFREIYRVLKPNGAHIFTVPFHEKKLTVNRMKGKLPTVFHGDPLSSRGIKVVTDFGEDISGIMSKSGFKTEIAYLNKWYRPEQITQVNNKKDMKSLRDGGPLYFFKYNNMVFIARKGT